VRLPRINFRKRLVRVESSPNASATGSDHPGAHFGLAIVSVRIVASWSVDDNARIAAAVETARTGRAPWTGNGRIPASAPRATAR